MASPHNGIGVIGSRILPEGHMNRRKLEFVRPIDSVGELAFKLGQGRHGLRCVRIVRTGIIERTVTRGNFSSASEWDLYLRSDPLRPGNTDFFEEVRATGNALLR